MSVLESKRMTAIACMIAAIFAVFSTSAAVFAQQPGPSPASKDTDLAQIREQLRAIDARLTALERRAPPDAPLGAGRADAEKMLLQARGAYREAYGKAREDYRNKMAECENLEGKAKVTCAQEAKATRDKAIDKAETARRRTEDEAYALAPDLLEPYRD
jgi:hypothetical protein